MSVHIKFIYDLIETCSFTTGSIFLTVVMVKLVFRFSQEKNQPNLNHRSILSSEDSRA